MFDPMQNEFESLMDFENNIAELDKALTEPFILNVLNMAQEWNDLLTVGALNDEEAGNLIGSLDYEWGSLFGATLQVTGNVKHLNPDGEVITRFYEDAEMISNGFILVQSSLDENDKPTPGQKVVLQFLVPIAESEMGAYEENGIVATHLKATAEVDKVNVVAEVGMSPERTRAWLSTFTPEIIDAIDDAVLNSDGTIGDTVARVQELELIPQCAPDDFRRACVGVAIYLKSIIAFDENLPYVASMSGKAAVSDDEGYDQHARVQGKESFVYIQDVSVAFVDDESMRQDDFSLNIMDHIYLNAIIINKNDEGVDLKIKIPFDTIMSIESIKPLVESGL